MLASSPNPRRPWRLAFLLAAAFTAGLAGGSLEAREEFARVLSLLSSGKTVVGETIVYPTAAPAKVTAEIVTLKPGEATGLHIHGIPVFGYMLEGELTVDYGDKGKRVYKAGDALLEAIDVPHDGVNTGGGPMRILAVFMGAEGLPTSVLVKAP